MSHQCEMSGYTKAGKLKKNAICNTHTFLMKPINGTAKFRNTTKINMCPLLNKTSNLQEKSFPVYNDDGKGHLPAFLLESDMNYYKTYEQRYIREHETKILEDNEEKVDMFEPMPVRKNKYCGVCKDDYDDYLTHIRSPHHKACLKKNRFTGYISRMCQEENRSQRAHPSEVPSVLPVDSSSTFVG